MIYVKELNIKKMKIKTSTLRIVGGVSSVVIVTWSNIYYKFKACKISLVITVEG